MTLTWSYCIQRWNRSTLFLRCDVIILCRMHPKLLMDHVNVICTRAAAPSTNWILCSCSTNKAFWCSVLLWCIVMLLFDQHTAFWCSVRPIWCIVASEQCITLKFGWKARGAPLSPPLCIPRLATSCHDHTVATWSDSSGFWPLCSGDPQIFHSRWVESIKVAVFSHTHWCHWCRWHR